MTIDDQIKPFPRAPPTNNCSHERLSWWSDYYVNYYDVFISCTISYVIVQVDVIIFGQTLKKNTRNKIIRYQLIPWKSYHNILKNTSKKKKILRYDFRHFFSNVIQVYEYDHKYYIFRTFCLVLKIWLQMYNKNPRYFQS